MYNLIKRALVTIDENETIKLYKKEDMTSEKDGTQSSDSFNSNQQKNEKTSDPQEVSPAISLAKEKARVILEEAEKEAEVLSKKAQETADEIIKKADQLLEKAKKDLALKEEKLKKQYEERYKTSIQALTKARDFFEKSENEYTELTAEKVRMILNKLIEKILYLLLNEHHEQILGNKIHEMIVRVMNLKEIVFRFNPSDLTIIPESVKQEMLETLTAYDIRQDSSISKGSVIVETNYGTLDGTFENQMEIINDMIEQVFGGEE